MRDVGVRSPGLCGEIEVHQPTGAAIGDIACWTKATQEALRAHHFEVERIVEMRQTLEPAGLDVHGPLFDHLKQPAFQLELPNPGPDHGQVILATNESGVVGVHFPRLDSGGIDYKRADDVLRYRIPRDVVPTEEPDGPRGMTSAFGGKVLSSLVFPLTDPDFGQVGDKFARRWERKRSPYRFRTFTSENFAEESAEEPDWDHLCRGKALLFVHGTFSATHRAFKNLNPGLIDELHDRYDGRVFAFDHPTLSHDPATNVKWFFDEVPPDVELCLDIVCHSRGGLVSRVIAEQPDSLGVVRPGISVDKVVFVGVPNKGTILTEPEHTDRFVESQANILDSGPGRWMSHAIEGLMTVVKHVAVGAMKGLPGLQSMRPSGDFLKRLNQPAKNRDSKYYAIAGDYEPGSEGLKRLKNRVMDSLFGEPNDLVVPRYGTYGPNGSNHFPIHDRLQLDPTEDGDLKEGVEHGGYFAQDKVRECLDEWLKP